MKNPFPVKTKSVSHGTLSRFFGIGLFIVFMSCSSIHKLTNKQKEKDTTIDKSVINEASTNQTITTEKADTVVTTKADTGSLNVFVPVIAQTIFDTDTTSFVQDIETDHLKISIKAKPVIVNGKRTGTDFTATAIKKAEDLTIKVDKQVTTNSYAVNETRKDVTQAKNVNTVTKDVAKKKFNIAGMLCIWFLFLIILFAGYEYAKQKSHGQFKI